MNQEILSPKFVDEFLPETNESPKRESRKWSQLSAFEYDRATPETKYRSSYAPVNYSKLSNISHNRQKTAKFYEEQPKLYDEIEQLFKSRQFTTHEFQEPKIQFCENNPKKITLKRPTRGYQICDNLQLIEKMHIAKLQVLQQNDMF
ncbi:hypothetical protein pb186bvf_020221 [Paramecium bursaria]